LIEPPVTIFDAARSCQLDQVRRVLVFVIVGASLSLAACSRREGLNFDCAWPADSTSQVDLQDEAQVQHLLDDLRTAEELAIRYGDRITGWRLVDTFGIVTRHGGATNREAGRLAREQCTGTLFQTIASRHGLTLADIERTRPRLGERGLDLPVTIPVLLLLAFALTQFTRWLRRRFESDEWLGWIVATVMGSVGLPAVVIATGAAWALVVEIVRIGNEHLSFRARPESLRANLLVLFAVGVVATWIACAIALRRQRAESRTTASL
jgi:hypothetical protein